MRQSRFREEMIVREHEASGLPVSSFMRRHGVTRQTFYRWRKKYGGLTEDEAQRLKRLEQENARLPRRLAARHPRYGAPRHLRSDNGPEFIAHRVQRWLARRGIQTAYIAPRKPRQNGGRELPQPAAR